MSQQRNVESFSAQTKEELLRTSPSHKGCKQAEMAAVIQACGSLVLTQRGLHLELISDHPALVRRMFGYCKQMTGQSAQLLVRQNRRLHKRNSYILRLIGRETVLGLLTELGLWQGGMMQGMPQTIRNTCCRRAYVRGLFLCCGSVTNPEKAYHLEWNCKEEALCQALYKQLRQMRNKANRAMNCDTANINKTMTAAAKQQACIRFLVKENRFETMNAGLKMAAETRLAYPEATLEELGELMEPRMGKSGVNHRMRKLVQMAEEMGFVFEEGMEV